MAASKDLTSRIDEAFTNHEQWLAKIRGEQLADYEGRRERLKLFDPLCERLKEIWRPRLEMLAERFGQEVEVTPSVTPGRRAARFAFDSKLASIDLRFSASTDSDVRKLVLAYDLKIIPILMKFEPHAEIEFPIEDVDDNAVARWIDDRIVEFVRTYLSLHENEYYLKDQMVEDPVSGTR
ncbi:MAG: hypothetical protein R3344_14200, partial [Acidobacteriota bacterium]|nr:hypothetical protein [Acidobacteriota bacterium]